MNEKEVKTPQPEEQKLNDARFWQEAKYEDEKHESER